MNTTVRGANTDTVMGAFANVATAEAYLKKSNPTEVVLADVRLPGRSGIDLIPDGAPRLPGTAFLVLSIVVDDDLVFAALEAGASGSLLKRTLPPEVADAVRELHAGRAPISSIAREVVATLRRDQRGLEELSTRENQLLECLARGRTYKECASDLGIALDTIRSHIRRIYHKLHVRSRHEAVAKLRGFQPPQR